MRKHLLCLLGLMFAVICARAASGNYKSIIITKADDSKIAISMERGMNYEIGNGEFVIHGSDSSLALPTSDVKTFTFSEEHGQPLDMLTTFIPGLEDDSAVIIKFDEGLTLENLPAGTPVGLYDMLGRVLQSAVASGTCRFDLLGVPKGIYVLSYGNQSIKFAIK